MTESLKERKSVRGTKAKLEKERITLIFFPYLISYSDLNKDFSFKGLET